MASEPRVNQKSVEDLFAENLYFFIPEFQRTYAWKTSNNENSVNRQVNQLFDDIYNSFQADDKNYFLGTVITYYDDKNIKPENIGKYYLIDGQQRLTTLSILLRSYIKRLDSLKNTAGKRSTIPYETYITGAKGLLQKLIKNPLGEDFPTKLIVSSNPANSKYLEEFFENDERPAEKDHPQSKTLIAAAKVLDKKFEELSGKECIDFYTYLVKNVYFSHVETDNFLEGFIVFERQNDRGAPLSFSDIVKHFLLGEVAKKRSTFESKANSINRKWEEIQIDITTKASFSFDEFLRYFFLSNYGVFKRKNEIIPWLKSESGRDMTLMAEKPDDFISVLRTKADEFIDIRNNLGPGKIENYSLKYIKRFFKVKQHLPVLMSAYGLKKDEFKKAAILIEALVFVMKWADSRANYLESQLESLCESLVNNNFKEFESSIRELIETITTTAKQNIVNPEYLKQNSKGSGAPMMSKYIIWRIEHQLRIEGKDDPIGTVEDTGDQEKVVYDVDHIIEKGNTDTQVKSVDKKSNINDLQNWLDRIGNLTLLEWEMNQNVLQGWTPDQKINGKKENDDSSSEKLINGFADSKVFHTKSLSTGSFTSTSDIKTRQEYVRKKYAMKKIKLKDSEFFTLDHIIQREKIIFHILSQALLVRFDPHDVGYSFKDIINWNTSEKKQK